MNEQTSSFRPVGRDELAWLGTDPIPAKPYYDPAWFELEREAVFKRSWINFGHVCEVAEPGSFIRREFRDYASAVHATGFDKIVLPDAFVPRPKGERLIAVEFVRVRATEQAA